MKFINLKKFREDRELTQKDLVRITGLPQSTVSYIENGLQEICEKHLDTLKSVFPDVDFSPYIYESDNYAYSVITRNLDEDEKRKFEGDWSTPSPIERIDRTDILLVMGRVSVSFDGDILLDRNDGSFKYMGYYHLGPERFESECLVEYLASKPWFDDEIYEDFKRCYLIVCRLTGREPVSQTKQGC